MYVTFAGYVLLAAAQDVTIRLDESKSPVKVGESVVFTCTLQVSVDSVSFTRQMALDDFINEHQVC